MNKIVLISTVHNLNICEYDLNIVLKKLSTIFSNIYISVSTTTSDNLKRVFSQDKNVNYISIKPKGAADARRRILHFALNRNNAKSFFYCDFDKVVVAIMEKEKVFKEYIERLSVNGYLIIGRNDENFSLYPKTWQDTEYITNYVASILFGIEDIDITSGCCAFDNLSAKVIEDNSVEDLTDTEWPILCKDNKKEISYSSVSFLPFNSKYNSGKNDNNWKGYIPRLKLSLKAMYSFNNWQKIHSRVEKD